MRLVTASMDAYDLAGACQHVASFLDALTNWYVRRSRERFWRAVGVSAELDADKKAAYDTLHTVLEVLCRVAAPLLPLLSEHVYRGLTGARSVHLAAWPELDELVADDELVATMDLVRAVCSAGHSIRKATGRRARLPLSRLTFAGEGAPHLEPYLALIKEELNVKDVELLADPSALAPSVLAVVPAALGPRLGPKTQVVIDAVRRGDWRVEDERVVAGDIELFDGEYTLASKARDDATRVLGDDVGVVALDLEVSPELAREGVARDVVRNVQEARRDADLSVTDRIALTVYVEESLESDLKEHLAMIAAQTLSTTVTFAPEEARPEAVVLRRLPDGRHLGVELRLSS